MLTRIIWHRKLKQRYGQRGTQGGIEKDVAETTPWKQQSQRPTEKPY